MSEPPRGGYRGSTATARFTAQLVALVTPLTRRKVLRLARGYGLSQAEVMRTVVGHGIELTEKQYAKEWGPLNTPPAE